MQSKDSQEPNETKTVNLAFIWSRHTKRCKKKDSPLIQNIDYLAESECARVYHAMCGSLLLSLQEQGESRGEPQA